MSQPPTTSPPSSPASGPEIDDPVGAFNHFEIVLDHDQRMPGVDQSLEQLQQHRDIIEMQSGGRFVENEKIAKRFSVEAAVPAASVFASQATRLPSQSCQRGD